jgi:hypothetical protein
MEAPGILQAFENAKPQIGACGIWCGSCVIGNGTLRQLSAKYSELLEDYGLEEWGPKDFNFGELRKGLRSLQEVAVCPGCRQGGGRVACEIRTCAAKQDVAFCGTCGTSQSCPHRELLDHMQAGALRAGLVVDPSPATASELVEAWTAELKARWPGSVLFSPCS